MDLSFDAEGEDAGEGLAVLDTGDVPGAVRHVPVGVGGQVEHPPEGQPQEEVRHGE